jgi:flagellar assembly factor FliW
MTDARGLDEGTVAVDSAVLGRVAVPAASVYTLPAGLVGFGQYTRYALVPSGREGVFWLQSLDEPSLAFVLADPFRAVPGYAADIPDPELAPLGAGGEGDFVVLVVVTLSGTAGVPATANLRAPLVFNVVTRRARQIVLPDDRLGTAEPIQL